MTGLLIGLAIVIAIVVLAMLLVAASKRRVEQLRVRAAAGDESARMELQRLESMQRALEKSQGKPDPEAERILAHGLEGRGTVKAVKRLGFNIRRGAEKLCSIDVTLSVCVEGREPFDAIVNDMVSEPLIGRLLIGATVPVRVDPNPPGRVIALWDHA